VAVGFDVIREIELRGLVSAHGGAGRNRKRARRFDAGAHQGPQHDGIDDVRLGSISQRITVAPARGKAEREEPENENDAAHETGTLSPVQRGVNPYSLLDFALVDPYVALTIFRSSAEEVA